MIIKNAVIYDGSFRPVKADLKTENGLISEIGEISGDDHLDARDLFLLPGFVDIHIHGAAGADLMSGKEEDVQKVSSHLFSHGITTFCPTTLTASGEQLENAFSAVAKTVGRESGAAIAGINMEGPYISLAKCGAQDPKYIRKPDFDEFTRLNSICPILLADIAPEVEGAEEFAKRASEICKVSMAHTQADYETASAALSSYFSHATHLFNAMTPMNTRQPGVVGAVFDSDSATAELICDGIHVHPAVIRTAFRVLGEDRICVISDAVPAVGLPDGKYVLGELSIVIKDNVARLEDGTIAGSVTNVFDEFVNLLSFGVPFSAALKVCTINPARAIGLGSQIGSIEVGKRADFILINKFNEIVNVFKGA